MEQSENPNRQKMIDALKSWKENQDPDKLVETIHVEGIGDYNIDMLIEEIESGSETGDIIIDKIATLAIKMLFR